MGTEKRISTIEPLAQEIRTWPLRTEKIKAPDRRDDPVTNPWQHKASSTHPARQFRQKPRSGGRVEGRQIKKNEVLAPAQGCHTRFLLQRGGFSQGFSLKTLYPGG